MKKPPNDIGEAIQNLKREDAMTEGGQPATGTDVTAQAEAAVQQALEGGVAVFNTHSQALAGRLLAEGQALKAIADDIDKKISALNAERTDVMLAWSGCNAALQAIQK